MKNLKLIKRSENVNYAFNDDGKKTESTTQNVDFKIMDEGGAEIGSANVHQYGISMSINNPGGSIADNIAIVEAMFKNFSNNE